MALDEEALREARDARERLLALQRELEQARAAYHGEIGRLHAGGASLREIADALGLSHQRVHQIIEALGHEPPPESGSDPSPPGAVGRRTPGGGGQGLLGGARPSWRAALLVLLTIGGVISSMALWPTRAFADPARYSPAQGAAAEGVPPKPTNTGGAVATAQARSLHTPGLSLSLALPAGWSGFSYRGGTAGHLPVLRMASFPLPWARPTSGSSRSSRCTLRASACSAPRGLRDHASPTPGAGQRQSGRPNRRRSHRDEADGST